MTTTSILIGITLVVWVSLVVARLLKRTPPTAPTVDGLRAQIAEALARWYPILPEGRALTDEELKKYVDFVGLDRAWSAAALGAKGHREGMRAEGREGCEVRHDADGGGSACVGEGERGGQQ